jgi:hypothetical protein
VTWQDNANNETGFELQREKRVGTSWSNTVTFTLGADVAAYADTPGAGKFRYRVRAFNAAGSSARTAWAQVLVSQ